MKQYYSSSYILDLGFERIYLVWNCLYYELLCNGKGHIIKSIKSWPREPSHNSRHSKTKASINLVTTAYTAKHHQWIQPQHPSRHKKEHHTVAGRVARSIARLTKEPEGTLWLYSQTRYRCPDRPHTFVSPSADSRKAVVSYSRKSLGGLRLPVRFPDRPDMTIPYCRWGKTKTQQQ